MVEDSSKKHRPPLLGYSGDPSGPAYESWREELSRRVMTGDVVPLAEGLVYCDITALPLPNVKMPGAGIPMQFVATGADPDNALAFVLASASPMRIVVGNRMLDVTMQGAGLADAAHIGTEVSQLSDGRFQSLFIDRAALLERCPHAEDLIARPLEANPAVIALLQNYYDIVIRHAADLDAVARNAIAQHLMDLVVLSLGAGRDDTELAKDRGLAAARLESIKTDILTRLGNPELNLAAVAQRNRASPRYVQMLFERAGTTFSAFVLEQRLMMAARLLRDPANLARKISDIAHLAGFNDVSYFHRSFRRRYGKTPLDMRNGSISDGL